jgi:diaminopropionate ammonia-lyase
MNSHTFSHLQAAEIFENYRPTSLIELPRLARRTNVGRVFVKVEGERPLGNFKVLGGMIAGFRALARATGATTLADLISYGTNREPLPRLLCASDGNHGLAVAAAAQQAGTKASIYLPENVSRARVARIAQLGAEIVTVTGTYDDAVDAAAAAAHRGEGLLVPDTSSELDDVVVKDVMAGYGLLTEELLRQLQEVGERPSHMFVQAGVGGLAAAMAEGVRAGMRDSRRLLIVEPRSAAAVAAALAAGHPVRIPGDLSTSAEMLSCGLASAPALQILLRHDAQSVLVDEDQLRAAVSILRDAEGPDTTPSGAAGLAGLLHAASHPDLRSLHELDENSCVLLIATEGASAESA